MSHAVDHSDPSPLNAAGRRSGGVAPKGTRNATARTNRSARSAPLKGVAAAEGFPYSTTRDAGLRGEFPIIRIGRALYVRWADFDRWVEAQKERA